MRFPWDRRGGGRDQEAQVGPPAAPRVAPNPHSRAPVDPRAPDTCRGAERGLPRTVPEAAGPRRHETGRDPAGPAGKAAGPGGGLSGIGFRWGCASRWRAQGSRASRPAPGRCSPHPRTRAPGAPQGRSRPSSAPAPQCPARSSCPLPRPYPGRRGAPQETQSGEGEHGPQGQEPGHPRATYRPQAALDGWSASSPRLSGF